MLAVAKEAKLMAVSKYVAGRPVGMALDTMYSSPAHRYVQRQISDMLLKQHRWANPDTAT